MAKKKKHPRVLDRTGQRYGMLTALEFVGLDKDGHGALWRCKCDCGNYVIVRAAHLTSNKTRSCGCLRYRSARNTTLCWNCKKATDGRSCSWVRDYTPVDGWTAKETHIAPNSDSQYSSYIVKACPQFEPDGKL